MNRHQIVALILASLLVSAYFVAEAQPLATNALLATGQDQTAKLTWLSDLPKALARAKNERKSVLLFFHGSDWCPTCVEMQRQVFDTPAFADYARQRLVLVDVDFPQKQKQNEDLRRANLALKAKFNLNPEASEGFPTLVLLADSGETVFQKTGYAGGGPAEILPKLQRHAGTGMLTGGNPAAKDLSVEEFARMAADKQNVILDVRTAGEFAAGHLPGAINLDVAAADFAARAATLDKNKVYLVHCAAGVRSARACAKLVSLGFPNLYNLPGGFRAWVKAGQPVEK
jgi:protein disulfide-isomerase